MEREDIPQILYQLGVDFNTERDSDEFSIYLVPDFGLKVIWSMTKYDYPSDDWRVVMVYSIHSMKEARENIIWGLAKGGFFHYLRNQFPNTFNKMLAGREGEDWHSKIIKKRLESYGDKPKYNYFRELNRYGLQESSMVNMSLDPGFYDFLLD